MKALGANSSISKSEVSRVCADLGAFRDRDLSGVQFPYVFLDATYYKARVEHPLVFQAFGVAVGFVAVGVAADGPR